MNNLYRELAPVTDAAWAEIEQEATRDLYAAGAVEAGDEDDYFQSNLFTVARRRVVWLSVLVVAGASARAFLLEAVRPRTILRFEGGVERAVHPIEQM